MKTEIGLNSIDYLEDLKRGTNRRRQDFTSRVVAGTQSNGLARGLNVLLVAQLTTACWAV
jgi:hypothetical protein